MRVAAMVPIALSPSHGLSCSSCRVSGLICSVQVIGDMMAQSFDTKGLVTQPSGCGEQNMIGMAPNTYVVQYMEATGKVDADVRARAVRFMGQGYQRELNYRHNDGSYSAFGEGTAEGSTWLTAFVTKVFAQSAPYMQGAVSSEVLADGIRWLEGMQVRPGGGLRLRLKQSVGDSSSAVVLF